MIFATGPVIRRVRSSGIPPGEKPLVARETIPIPNNIQITDPHMITSVRRQSWRPPWSCQFGPNLISRDQDPMIFATASPSVAGLSLTVMPASRRAAILLWAVPSPPEMIAPA